MHKLLKFKKKLYRKTKDGIMILAISAPMLVCMYGCFLYNVLKSPSNNSNHSEI